MSQNFRDYYDLGEKIGEGGFGVVYKAKVKGTNEQRAIKLVDKNTIKDNISKQSFREPTQKELDFYYSCLKNEVKNMQMMEGDNGENENTVKFEKYFENENEFVIIMELCDDNLWKVFIRRNTEQNPFNEEDIYEILSQLNYSFRMMAA